jgi:hypothetical protein
MKRFFLVSLFGAGCAVLWGCPIYPDAGNHRVCNSSGCYDCPSDTYSSGCVPWQCNSSYDCPSGYHCDSSYTCVSGGSSNPPPPTTDC